MRKLIEATFTGTSGSMGYVKGKSYTLELTQYWFGTRVTIRNTRGYYGMTIRGTYCPYSNMLTFLDNWDVS